MVQDLEDEPEPCASIDVYIYICMYVRERGQYIQARWTSMSDSLERWKEMVLLIDTRLQSPEGGTGALPLGNHPLDDRVQAGFFFRGSSDRGTIHVTVASNSSAGPKTAMLNSRTATWLYISP